jgi:hypothetical protein
VAVASSYIGIPFSPAVEKSDPDQFGGLLKVRAASGDQIRLSLANDRSPTPASKPARPFRSQATQLGAGTPYARLSSFEHRVRLLRVLRLDLQQQLGDGVQDIDVMP